MRRTRFTSWVFLFLSLAFFLVRHFRQALEVPLANIWSIRFRSGSWEETSRGLGRLFTLARYAPPNRLRKMAEDALLRGDDEFAAFAALELPIQQSPEEVLRLADQVASARRDLTWIYLPVCLRIASGRGLPNLSAHEDEALRARLGRVRAFEPENGAPDLALAILSDAASSRNLTGKASGPSTVRAVLEQQMEWQKEMAAAFAKPRFDSYAARAFDLKRKVMFRQRWTHPVVVGSTLADYPYLDIGQAQKYVRALVDDRGKPAEDAGRLEEALRDYWQVARFGLRLKLQASTFMEELVGQSIQTIAYRRLAPALRKSGRAHEAALVEYVQQRTLEETRRRSAALALTSNYEWSVLVASLSALLVGLFLLIYLAAIVSSRVRAAGQTAEGEENISELLLAAKNYGPIGLFGSCLALYLASVPFTQNLVHDLTTQEPTTYIPVDLFGRFFPLTGTTLGALEPTNPLPEYTPWALAVILLAVALAWFRRRKTQRPATPELGKRAGNLTDQVVYLVALVGGVGWVSAVKEAWEIALIVEVVLALLVLVTVWATSSFARRFQSPSRRSWATWMAGAGTILVLLVAAGLSGKFLAVLARTATGREIFSVDTWTLLVALFPVAVAGSVGASRVRPRALSLGAFALLALVVASLAYK